MTKPDTQMERPKMRKRKHEAHANVVSGRGEYLVVVLPDNYRRKGYAYIPCRNAEAAAYLADVVREMGKAVTPKW